MKFINLIFMLFILYGCTSTKVDLNDINEAQNERNFQLLNKNFNMLNDRLNKYCQDDKN